MKKLLSFLLCGIIASCNTAPTRETSSPKGSQLAFYPDRFEPTVGDLILSLPAGYYESAPNRLNFAKQILDTGTPKPAEHQEIYLKISADGLSPTRHFMALDSRHLLVFSEELQLEDGYPPRFELFRRIGDATWKDASRELIPTSIANPVDATFYGESRSFVVRLSGGRSETYRWNGSRLTPLQ